MRALVKKVGGYAPSKIKVGGGAVAPLPLPAPTPLNISDDLDATGKADAGLTAKCAAGSCSGSWSGHPVAQKHWCCPG